MCNLSPNGAEGLRGKPDLKAFAPAVEESAGKGTLRPGDSMAKAKGTTLVGSVRFLRKHKQRARELLPQDLHHYLEERIHESRWYPESDLHQLLQATVSLMPGSRAEILARLGEATAREHLEGIYSHLAKGTHHGVARRALALWSSQHDSGSFEVEQLSPSEALMTIRDFAHPSEIMCGILGGYLAEALRVDGATDVKIEKKACVLRGDPACSWIRRSGARSGR